MKKIVVIGMFFLAISLVIGVTWIGPVARSNSAEASTASSDAVVYRTDAANGTMVNVDLTADETVQEIAPDVKYHVWTFNGTTPAPVIRVHLGDTIHFTLTNASTIGMQHSIDFHAAMTPWADLPPAGSTTLTGNYQPVNPGETKTFDWVAMFPGVFMYHCGVPPVLQHISNGMYGAIIVEPENLPAEREYVLVSSEFYPGAKPIKGVYEGDIDRMLAVDPEYVVFNGVADQYKTTPLEVRPNEPFRIWVMNAGPTLTNAFHVIGTMFDKTYPSGNLGEHPVRPADLQHPAGRRRDVRVEHPRCRPLSVRDARVRLHGARRRGSDQGRPRGARCPDHLPAHGRPVLRGRDGVPRPGWIRWPADPDPADADDLSAFGRGRVCAIGQHAAGIGDERRVRHGLPGGTRRLAVQDRVRQHGPGGGPQRLDLHRRDRREGAVHRRPRDGPRHGHVQGRCAQSRERTSSGATCTRRR